MTVIFRGSVNRRRIKDKYIRIIKEFITSTEVKNNFKSITTKIEWKTAYEYLNRMTRDRKATMTKNASEAFKEIWEHCELSIKEQNEEIDENYIDELNIFTRFHSGFRMKDNIVEPLIKYLREEDVAKNFNPNSIGYARRSLIVYLYEHRKNKRFILTHSMRRALGKIYAAMLQSSPKKEVKDSFGFLEIDTPYEKITEIKDVISSYEKRFKKSFTNEDVKNALFDILKLFDDETIARILMSRTGSRHIALTNKLFSL